MMKPKRFDEMCGVISSALSNRVNLRFSVQTNAMLINEEWLEIFIKYDVGIGISIDGPKDIHDIDRLDHSGHGTYDKVVRGLRLVQYFANKGVLKTPGAIAVIRPTYSGKKVFEHLVGDLGIKHLSFLLPIDTHDSFNHGERQGYGRYLLDVFAAWAKHGDKSVRVRFIDEILRFLLNGAKGVQHRDESLTQFALFVVGSNGDLEPDDSMKVRGTKIHSWNVGMHTLGAFLGSAEMLEISEALTTVPAACGDCCWQNGCRGSAGRIVNRYSRNAGFSNRSFLCDELTMLYSEVAASLLNAEFTEKQIIESLDAPHLPYLEPRRHSSLLITPQRSTSGVIPIAVLS